ncbi:hypothetical protein DOY81_010339 [Sarcophaga bullata]|nr:hypothetical protein DOY81_010339 [Sarcophaga bullata]
MNYFTFVVTKIAHINTSIQTNWPPLQTDENPRFHRLAGPR